jgi:hypothetical protein
MMEINNILYFIEETQTGPKIIELKKIGEEKIGQLVRLLVKPNNIETTKTFEIHLEKGKNPKKPFLTAIICEQPYNVFYRTISYNKQAVIDDYIKKLKEVIKYKKEAFKKISKEIVDCENELNIISNLK